MIFLSAFVLGLMGSLHCLGMCGPLALALPFNNMGNTPHQKWQFGLGHLLYNGGRIATYTLLGAGLGGAGWLLLLSGLQQQISIAAGSIILLLLLLQGRVTVQFTPLLRVKYFVQGQFGKLLSSKPGVGVYFGLGLLNGLLPCGLVYAAFAGSAWVGSVWGGALFMTCFGLGTLPMMVLAGSMSRYIKPVWYRQALRVASFIVGGLLIVRGLNLGIPYLSPKQVVPTAQAAISVCH